ncbi:hypothetical protein D9M69_724050 [compost metagenome]
MAVDGGIGTAVDHRTATRGDANPITVAPHLRVSVVVTVQVTLAAFIVPEVQRHARHRPGADQFTDLVDQRLSGVVKGLHRGA